LPLHDQHARIGRPRVAYIDPSKPSNFAISTLDGIPRIDFKIVAAVDMVQLHLVFTRDSAGICDLSRD